MHGLLVGQKINCLRTQELESKVKINPKRYGKSWWITTWLRRRACKVQSLCLWNTRHNIRVYNSGCFVLITYFFFKYELRTSLARGVRITLASGNFFNSLPSVFVSVLAIINAISGNLAGGRAVSKLNISEVCPPDPSITKVFGFLRLGTRRHRKIRRIINTIELISINLLVSSRNPSCRVPKDDDGREVCKAVQNAPGEDAFSPLDRLILPELMSTGRPGLFFTLALRLSTRQNQHWKIRSLRESDGGRRKPIWSKAFMFRGKTSFWDCVLGSSVLNLKINGIFMKYSATPIGLTQRNVRTLQLAS